MDNWFQLNWPGMALVIGAVIAWFVRLEARMNGKLSIEAHQKICDTARSEDKATWAEIRKLILDSNSGHALMKDVINSELNEIKIKLAVLVSQGKS